MLNYVRNVSCEEVCGRGPYISVIPDVALLRCKGDVNDVQNSIHQDSDTLGADSCIRHSMSLDINLSLAQHTFHLTQ